MFKLTIYIHVTTKKLPPPQSQQQWKQAIHWFFPYFDSCAQGTWEQPFQM